MWCYTTYCSNRPDGSVANNSRDKAQLPTCCSAGGKTRTRNVLCQDKCFSVTRIRTVRSYGVRKYLTPAAPGNWREILTWNRWEWCINLLGYPAHLTLIKHPSFHPPYWSSLLSLTVETTTDDDGAAGAIRASVTLTPSLPNIASSQGWLFFIYSTYLFKSDFHDLKQFSFQMPSEI